MTASTLDRDDVIARLRQHLTETDLPEATQQLLRDAAAALVQLAPGPRDVDAEVADPVSTPNDKTMEDLIEAALAHADQAGSLAFFVPVKNTTPPLVVGLGERSELAALLSISTALNDGS